MCIHLSKVYFISSHFVNFPLCQFPFCQFPLCQHWPNGNWQNGIWQSGKLTKWELMKWELTKWELTKWEDTSDGTYRVAVDTQFTRVAAKKMYLGTQYGELLRHSPCREKAYIKEIRPENWAVSMDVYHLSSASDSVCLTGIQKTQVQILAGSQCLFRHQITLQQIHLSFKQETPDSQFFMWVRFRVS